MCFQDLEVVFSSIEEDDVATGINEWWETSADSLRHANSDAHGLRATDANENSSRGNKHFGSINNADSYAGSFWNSGKFLEEMWREQFFI